MLKQAEVKFALGRHAEHIAALEQIRDLVEETSDPRAPSYLALLERFLAQLDGGPAGIAIEHCRRGRAISAAAGLTISTAYADPASHRSTRGRRVARRDRGRRPRCLSLKRAESVVGEPHVWHLARRRFISASGTPASPIARALAHGERLGDLRIKAVGLWRMGAVHIHRGDAARGVQHCNEALALGALPYER